MSYKVWNSDLLVNTVTSLFTVLKLTQLHNKYDRMTHFVTPKTRRINCSNLLTIFRFLSILIIMSFEKAAEKLVPSVKAEEEEEEDPGKINFG